MKLAAVHEVLALGRRVREEDEDREKAREGGSP